MLSAKELVSSLAPIVEDEGDTGGTFRRDVTQYVVIDIRSVD